VTIVARGLGLGYGALLVTAGLGLSSPAIEPSPDAGGGFAPRARIVSAVDFHRDDEDIMVIILAALHVIDGA
jgi:hypothetical protein